MTKKYVFTPTQFTRVVLAGMNAAGLVSDDIVKNDADKATRFEQTENGIIVEIGLPEARVDSRVKTGTVDNGGDEGPSSEAVSAALKKAMEHPPWMNSINAWDAKKKRAALKWAKNPTASAMPGFIKSRKPRKDSKKTPSVPPEAPTALTAPVNGIGSVARSFFDKEESESASAE